MAVEPAAKGRIAAAFAGEFGEYGLELPPDFDHASIPRSIGRDGWTMNIRFVPEHEGGALEVFASHRLVGSDTLYRFAADGSTTVIGGARGYLVVRPGDESEAAEAALHEHNRTFYADVEARGLFSPATESTSINAALKMGLVDDPR
jgi:hypothetical protein